MNLSNWAKDDLFVEGANNLKIQTLRIIRPSTLSIQVHINAIKRMDGKYYTVDKTLNFDTNHINKPYIFINIVRSGYKVFRRIMKISNNDFAWKNNYLKPSIINSLDQSVKYEYRLPEKRIIQIK